MFRIKEILSNTLQEDGRKATAVWLSEKINMAQPNVNNIVNNKATPTLDTLIKIAGVLNVHISELFDNPDSNVFRCPKCGITLEIKEKQ